MPVTVAIAQIALLRQHVAHSPGFHGRQFLILDCCRNGLNHLSFCASSEYQVRLLDRTWEIGARGRRVKADRSTPLRIPKARVIDWSSPGTLYHAHETVLPLN